MTTVGIRSEWIGPRSGKLRFGIRSWLDLNCQKIWSFTYISGCYVIEFHSDADAMLFRMIWL